MNSPTRPFHLGDVLSVTTGLLVGPGHMQGIHELLDFMTGDSLFTHQLPRAMEECGPELLRQHPDLAAVEVPDAFPEPCAETVPAWLAAQGARFGERRDVAPLAPGDHTRVDPIAELLMMRPDMPVIAVVPDEEGRT